MVEPVNWVEEKLLGGYKYNHTTPDWVTVLHLSVVEPVNWVEENLLGGYKYNRTTPDCYGPISILW